MERFKLQVRLTIAREEWSGPLTADGKPDEKSGGYWRNNMNEQLSVNEDLNLGALDFMGVMGVLGELHESIIKMKK
jgi:hypothetical protein